MDCPTLYFLHDLKKIQLAEPRDQFRKETREWKCLWAQLRGMGNVHKGIHLPREEYSDNGYRERKALIKEAEVPLHFSKHKLI